jgi:hypothetical protein
MFVLAWLSRQVKAFCIKLSILYHYIVCERILFAEMTQSVTQMVIAPLTRPRKARKLWGMGNGLGFSMFSRFRRFGMFRRGRMPELNFLNLPNILNLSWTFVTAEPFRVRCGGENPKGWSGERTADQSKPVVRRPGDGSDRALSAISPPTGFRGRASGAMHDRVIDCNDMSRSKRNFPS